MFWKIKNWFIDTRIGFKNLFYWLPIIWQDRDWNRDYIFVILKHKIENSIKVYEWEKQFVEFKPDVAYKHLYPIRDILTNIIKSEYSDKSENILFEKSLSFEDWCALSMKDNEKLYQLKQKMEKNDYDKLFKLLSSYYKKFI